MRVIAGRWKGRRLKSPRDPQVRPTTDRVKEAIFNILGLDIRGCLFLDLCCGAGGLGVEALSRGAASVVFVDRSRSVLDLVRENLEVCGAEAGQARLVRADAADWLQRWNPDLDQSPWVLAADPPYRSETAGVIMKELERLGQDPGFRAGVVEYGSRTPGMADETPSGLVWKMRKYGETHLAVARPSSEAPQQGEGP